MRAHVFLITPLFVLALLAAAAVQPARAQAPADGPWTPIVEQDSVTFSYLYYRHADNTNGGVVVKLENANAYSVAYRFEIIFRAGGEERVEEVSGTLEAGEMKTGDSAGLFWIPFRDGRGIEEVGLRGYAVEPRGQSYMP